MFNFVKRYHTEIVLFIAIVAITISSFNLGKIRASKETTQPVVITEPDGITMSQDNPIQKKNQPTETINPSSDIPVVVSKKSTSGAFHYPWCPSADRISDENKVTFEDATAAIAAGYHLAGNCKE